MLREAEKLYRQHYECDAKCCNVGTPERLNPRYSENVWVTRKTAKAPLKARVAALSRCNRERVQLKRKKERERQRRRARGTYIARCEASAHGQTDRGRRGAGRRKRPSFEQGGHL